MDKFNPGDQHYQDTIKRFEQPLESVNQVNSQADAKQAETDPEPFRYDPNTSFPFKN